MFSRRIVSQTTFWCIRQPPKLLAINSQRAFSQLSREPTQMEKSSKNSEPFNGIRKKKESKPKVNNVITDTIKVSFQKGGEKQRQSTGNALFNRNKPYVASDSSGYYKNINNSNNSNSSNRSNSMNARATTAQNFNTGGGGKQQPPRMGGRAAEAARGRARAEGAPKQTPPPKRTVQRGRVQESAKPTPTGDESAGASDNDGDSNQVSSGEAIFKQKQVHLQHKREQFTRDLPIERQPRFVRNAEPETPAAPVAEDPFLKVKSPQSVAEMKALAAERLANKIENPVASTWVDFKELRRQKRHARMNEIKEKNKIRKEKLWGKKPSESAGTIIYEIKIPHNGLTVRELSQRLSMKMTDTIQKLSEIGEIMDPEAEGVENLLIDPDVIELFAMDLNLTVTRQEAIYRDASEFIKKSNRVRPDAVLAPRSPIISVMGHVDHGKTTLLDRLREADAAGGEAGGITQKLSAFNVEMDDRAAVFLDTPGHAAFTGMRKSGAIGSDLVVLVVAIEDGVRPLTIEAAKVALKSGCTIVVALTKVDKITDPEERRKARLKTLTGLTEVDINAEEFGGDIQVVEVSGKTGEGVSDLVEKLLLQADMMELKASEAGGAEGVVLDAKIEKGRGVMVDLLIKWGTLKVGDAVVVGNAHGKVKAILNDKGKPIKSAGPSTPVRLLGLNTIPAAGQDIIGVENDSKAKKIAERRQRLEDTRRIKELNRRALAIEAEEDPIVVPVILKADSMGGLNALRSITDGLSDRTNDVIIHIIGSSIGDVTPSDVSLAKLVKDSPPATILGFNINNPNNAIRTSAKQNDVVISTDSVIYRLEEVLEDVMKSHMPMERISTLEGTANVLQLFSYKMSPSKVRKVAGVDVVSGAMKETSNHFFRVVRGEDTVLLESTGAQLKRFKDTVHEVKAGFECGLSLDNFESILPGDRIECYKFENVQKELIVHSNNKVTYAPVKKEDRDEQDSEKS